MNDNESAELLPYLEGAAQRIAAVLERGQNVLVHCQQVGLLVSFEETSKRPQF